MHGPNVTLRNQSIPRVLWVACGAFALTIAATSGSAFAQTVNSAASSEAGDLGTIVVTATRREAAIQTIPISVSAINSAELEARGVTNTIDVIRAVPGVSMDRPNSGLLRITIRGIGSDSGRPTVGYYLDDVPIATAIGDFTGAPDPMTFDMERVEVLKGPQGTFYGASAMGGALKFISQRPQLGGFDYNVGAEGAYTDGGSETYDVRGVVNVPLADTAAARFGALYRDNGGFIDRVPGGVTSAGATSFNTVDRKNANDSQTLMLRGSVLFEPTPTLRILPAVIHQKNSRDEVDTLWESLPEFGQSNVLSQENNDSFDLYTLTAEKEFEPATLSSITGYFDRDQTFTTDFTFFIGALVPPFATQPSPSHTFSEYENVTEELRLTSNGEGPFSWVLGGYYSRNELDLGQDVFTQDAGAILGLPPVNGVEDIVFTQRTNAVTKQYAAFGDATYDWTEHLSASVGLRWYNFDQSSSRDADGLFNGGPTGSAEDADSDGTVPRVSVSYKLGQDHLAYLSAQEGFRIGGANSVVPSDLCAVDLAALGLTDAPSQIQSDELWAYELGSKNTFFNGHMVMNIALFYNDWTKLQQSVDLPSCGFSFTGNVGAAHSQGGEVELRGRVTQAMDLSVGIAYTDSVIDEGAPGVDAQPGDRVLFTPEWTVNVSADYKKPLQSGTTLLARVDYQWRDEQFTSFTPGPGQIEEAYGVTNVSIGFRRNNWSLRAYANNVTNESPRFDYFDASNATTSTLRPLTVGVRFELQH